LNLTLLKIAIPHGEDGHNVKIILQFFNDFVIKIRLAAIRLKMLRIVYE